MDNYDLQVDIARRIFLAYDQERLIRKFCLDADGQWIYLTYLNTPCRISRENGAVEEYIENTWKECREYSTVMTVYDLLCYNKDETLPMLSGQWCAVGSFIVAGITETETFTKASIATVSMVPVQSTSPWASPYPPASANLTPLWRCTKST